MKPYRPWLAVLAGVALGFASFALPAAGFLAGAAAERADKLPGSIACEPADLASAFSPFWTAWGLVQDKYVDRAAVKTTPMVYGAIAGMLDSLGDTGHTRFLSPEDLRLETESLAGRLEGIGAEIGVRDGRPTIVAPMPGSPAQRAGVRPGDAIVRVDGKDISGLSIPQIVSLIRGPAGTSVTLTVLHRGDTGLTDIKVVRAQITVPNISWTIVPGTKVAHILVSQFGQRSGQEMVTALKAARSAGAASLILDLRNNPGGLRDEAIAVASQFLKSGNVLLEQDAQGKQTAFPVASGGVATDLPMVVIINEGSASSAEIVAGALQDQQRGKLVGGTTFGTGTVLSPFRLGDGSAMLLGTQEWLTPNGRQIWHHGIAPDLPVTLTLNVYPLIPGEESALTPEQVRASSDTQLLRALQELAAP